LTCNMSKYQKNSQIRIFDKMSWKKKLNGKKVEVEIQTSPKQEELIKFKDFIKLIIGLINLIKDLINKN
jgi:hypothetical protein